VTRAEKDAALVARNRARQVHGWAFRGLHPDEEAKIRSYLETGDADTLASIDWKHLASDASYPGGNLPRHKKHHTRRLRDHACQRPDVLASVIYRRLGQNANSDALLTELRASLPDPDGDAQLRIVLGGLYREIIEHNPEWQLLSDMRGFWLGRAWTLLEEARSE
jgi:hypothetical protein